MSKRFFLLGNWRYNAGPSNVNKSIVLNCDNNMGFIHSSNRIIRRLEKCKWLLYPVILVSGGASENEIKLFKFLRKKVIYLMHGCLWYEAKVNKLTVSDKSLNTERLILSVADAIVCVSEKYSEWVKDIYPEYANKIKYVNNGITLQIRPPRHKEQFSIAVSGGNRLQKNNGTVCRAIEKLNALGYDCHLYVFGRIYENNDDLSKYPFVKFMGHLNKEKYYEELDKISLFVLNSTVESFGLVVSDALNCNCSLLMSKNVGALSIMSTTENDVIKDCFDINEIASKILYLFKHPNSSCIYNSIDINEVSEKNAYLKLKRIINEI